MNATHPLSDIRRAELDAAAMELLQLHGVEQPPVPIEAILRHPVADLWEPHLDDLSQQSFDTRERYSSRPTIARLVARYAGNTTWARQRGLVDDSGLTPDEVRYFGRALLMPKSWMLALNTNERDPASVRVRFHVPLPDAAERLSELNLLPVEPSPTG